MFISNSTEMILGISFAIFIFLIFFFSILDEEQNLLENTPLNIFLLIVFILLFFLIGYLIQKVMLIFNDIRENKKETIVFAKENPLTQEKK